MSPSSLPTSFELDLGSSEKPQGPLHLGNSIGFPLKVGGVSADTAQDANPSGAEETTPNEAGGSNGSPAVELTLNEFQVKLRKACALHGETARYVISGPSAELLDRLVSTTAFGFAENSLARAQAFDFLNNPDASLALVCVGNTYALVLSQPTLRVTLPPYTGPFEGSGASEPTTPADFARLGIPHLAQYPGPNQRA